MKSNFCQSGWRDSKLEENIQGKCNLIRKYLVLFLHVSSLWRHSEPEKDVDKLLEALVSSKLEQQIEMSAKYLWQILFHHDVNFKMSANI